MQNLHIRFEVKVSNTEYSYQGQRGDAELKIQVPRSVLQHIDPGDLFTGILEAALVNFDAAEAEEKAKQSVAPEE